MTRPRRYYDLAARMNYERHCAWVAGWLSGRFGVTVTAAWVAKRAPRFTAADLAAYKPDGLWSGGTWAMWWKQCLLAAGFLSPGAASPDTTHSSVTLHLGFLYIDESPEQLAAIKDAYWRREAEREAQRVAGLETPGIARTVNFPEPIDRTAARVTAPATGGGP